MLIAGVHLIVIFSMIFTFSSVLKRNFEMCSVRSFVLTIVDQFMIIKFTLIGYYRMRYIFTKLPKNSFFKYIFKKDNIIKFCSVANVTSLKTKHVTGFGKMCIRYSSKQLNASIHAAA